MSNDIVAVQQAEEELITSLQSSVYVGADKDTIKLVISYCKAQSIDPLIKPVHIVPIDGKNVLFPSIALHRIRAHRSGVFLGMSEPTYGADVTEMVGKTKMTYPKDCRVTIKRLVGGQVADFTGIAVWKESYQTVADKISPNIFWYKRPYSQLYKCAEADALKKAFPEIAGSVPTYEEYNPALKEEKVVNNVGSSTQVAVENVTQSLKAKLTCVNTETGEIEVIEDEKAAKEQVLSELKALITEQGISAEQLKQWKDDEGIATFSEMSIAKLVALVNALQGDK